MWPRCQQSRCELGLCTLNDFTKEIKSHSRVYPATLGLVSSRESWAVDQNQPSQVWWMFLSTCHTVESPYVMLNFEIKTITRCDGYSWLSTWLLLEWTKTQVAGHTCAWLFLIELLEVGNLALNLVLLKCKDWPYIWATPFLSSLYKRCGRRKRLFFLCLLALTYQQVHSFTATLEFRYILKTRSDIQPCGLNNYWIFELSIKRESFLK